LGQSRDKPDPDLGAFGELLRQWRGRRTLRALEKEVPGSRSTLSRLERGEIKKPDAGLVECLDKVLGAGGALIAGRQHLLQGVASPIERPFWRKVWKHWYPAEYHGEVYLNVVLPAEDRPAKVRLWMEWGPWRLNDQPVRIDDPEGRNCLFGKGDDGLSLVVVARFDRRVSASFGMGIPPGPFLDINDGWTRDD